MTQAIEITEYAEVAEVLRKFLLRNLRTDCGSLRKSAEVNFRNLRKSTLPKPITHWKRKAYPVCGSLVRKLRRLTTNSLILLAEVYGGSSSPHTPLRAYARARISRPSASSTPQTSGRPS